MATHVKVIAGLFFLVAGVFLLGAVFAPVLLSILAHFVGASGEPGAGVGAAFLGLTGVVLSLVCGAIALAYGACGWGLLKLRRWARIMAIILAAIALTHIPFGTLVGIYALIVLFQKKTEELFVA